MFFYTFLMDKSFVEVDMKKGDINYTGYFRCLPDIYGGNVCDISQFLIINCIGWQNWMPNATAYSAAGRQDFYLLYIVRGEMTILSGEKPQHFSKGQIICFYSQTPYEYRSGKDGVFYYWLHFTGHSAKEILERCGIQNGKVYTVGENEEILKMWRDVFSEFSNQDSLFILRTGAKILNILTALSEKIEKPAGQIPSKKLIRSLDYIHENFNKNLSVQHLAELEHLSVSRFYTVFKENTGYSPSEYIIVLRINRACSMFMQTDMTVKEIAAQVGYKDSFYFSRLFKKYMKTSPCTYKKRIRQNQNAINNR